MAIFLEIAVNSVDRTFLIVICLFCQYCITKTSPCKEHPLTPHLYIEKLGFTRVYVFIFLLQNIDCGFWAKRRKLF